MWIWLPVPLLCITLILLIRAEESSPRDEQQVKLWKPLSTGLIILTCGLSFARPSGSYDTAYTLLVVVGLSLSLVGDVLLIFQDNPRAFLAGLVAFLLAHLMYIAAFVHVQSSFIQRRSGTGETAAAISLIIIGWAVYRYLRPGLDNMRLPVIAYMVVISVMVHRALAIAWVHSGPRTQPALIVIGALLFYLSDAILAINRFRLKGQMSHYRLWNLTTYYTGQLLIALSSWFF